MTGLLYAIARWCLSVLPVDAAGHRCLDETLADWRKEAAQASGAAAALVVPARAIWSVFRCVMMVSLREIRSREGAALLLRLAAFSLVCMLVFIGIRWNESIVVQGARVPLGPVPGALLSVASVLAVMPFLAFVSAAVGRQLSVSAPRLGPALISGAVMFFAMGWVMPVTNQAFRQLVFGLQSSGPIPPGINERSIVELIEMLFTDSAQGAAFGLNVRMVVVAAVPVMLALGASARQLRGRRRVVASLLPLLLFFVPFLANMGIRSVEGFLVMWPALLAVILITRALVRGAADNYEATPTATSDAAR